MRTLTSLLAGLGLLSTAAAALAEPPAKLSETELGQVAAGQQTLDSNFNLSTIEALTTTTTTDTRTNVNDNDVATSVSNSTMAAEQSLAGVSSNTVSALGMLDSSGVTATGNANTVLTGTVDNIVP
jgi:hypothetical protein